MGAALVLLLVGLGAMAAGVLLGRYYMPDDRQLRRTARHSKAYMRALSHLVARDHDTVISELRNVVEENVEDTEPYFALGAIFRSRGEHERAIRVHQALALRERDKRKLRQRAMYELGLDFRAAGMPRRATRALEEVVIQEPGHEGALRALAALYEEQARFNEAAGLWQRLGRRRGEDTSHREHHLLVAAAQSALGRDDLDSAKQLLKAAQKHEESAHFLAAAAELAAARGNHGGAKERLKQALIAEPGLAPHLLPGLIAAEQGLAREAGDKDARDDLDDDVAEAARLAADSRLALPEGTRRTSTQLATVSSAGASGSATSVATSSPGRATKIGIMAEPPATAASARQDGPVAASPAASALPPSPAAWALPPSPAAWAQPPSPAAWAQPPSPAASAPAASSAGSAPAASSAGSAPAASSAASSAASAPAASAVAASAVAASPAASAVAGSPAASPGAPASLATPTSAVSPTSAGSATADASSTVAAPPASASEAPAEIVPAPELDDFSSPDPTVPMRARSRSFLPSSLPVAPSEASEARAGASAEERAAPGPALEPALELDDGSPASAAGPMKESMLVQSVLQATSAPSPLRSPTLPGIALVPAQRPSVSIADRVLAVLFEIEAQSGPRLELALIRAQLVPPTDMAGRLELARELTARFPDALPARVATARLALATGDPAAIRAALDALVSEGGALAWAMRGRWQCAHCGNRPGPFSWRCGQCRRWSTLRMETGVEPPPVPPRERRAAPRVARQDALLGVSPDESLPAATLDPGLSDAELATASARRSLLGRVGGWVASVWRRGA